MPNKKTIIILMVLIVALVVFAIVFKIPKEKELEETNGIQENEPKIEEMDLASEIYAVSGEITEIKDKGLRIKALIPLALEEREPILVTISITINENTKMIKIKSPEGAMPEETDISLNDLEIGNIIDVGTNENISDKIKNNKEFTADYLYFSE